jgi:hypothetical protein
MAGRGPQTFQKRQKEQQRKEKQQEKMAKRLQRKQDKIMGVSDENTDEINDDIEGIAETDQPDSASHEGRPSSPEHTL